MADTPSPSSETLNSSFGVELALCETKISIGSSDPVLLANVLSFMRSTFVFSGQATQNLDDSIVWIIGGSSAPIDRSIADPLYESASLDVWKSDTGYRLRCGDSIIVLDPSAGTGRAYIASSFWESPLRDRRELFLIAMMMMLHWKKKWSLHAVALTSGDNGLLVMGDSGAGKTTTALALIREGWNFVSDDAICVAESATGEIEAHAFRRGFAPTADGWAALGIEKDPSEIGLSISPGKWLVDLHELLQDRQVSHCIPKVIVFPMRSKDIETRPNQISPAMGLARMIPQCAGITANKEQSAQLMRGLGLLARQVKFYELHTGRDVFDQPDRISALLKKLVGAQFE